MAQKFLTNFTPPGSSESYKFRAGGLFYGTTSNSTSAMTVSIPGVTEYYTGLTLILKMGAQAASGCTLNVNGLGAKAMKYGANSVGTYFASGATYLFVYDGTDFKAIHSYNSNTTYSAGTGLSLSGTTFNHKNSVTASTAKGSDTKTLTFGGTFALPTVSYDAQGHITGSGTTTMTMPSDRLFVTLVPTGTAIPANANLNTTTYMKVGRYFCSQTANAKTLQNCPVDVAFMMEVYSPLSTTIDNETTGTWVYRIRKITAYNTGMQFIQYASVGNTANTWTYGDWKVQPIANFTLDTTDKNGGTALTGSTTKPIYLKADGTFAACTYSLNKDVPSDAKFTDTTYSVVTSAANGLVPKFDAADGTIDSSSTDWVLTNNNGSIGWYKLPTNAFKNDNTNYYHSPSYATGLKIATGSGIGDLCVPVGTTNSLGVVKQHTSADCTTYTSDEGATTPAAVKKAIKNFINAGTNVTATWSDTNGYTISSANDDTKNTAGSTNSTSKLFLIGATTQAANPTTNSNSEVYGLNGTIHAKGIGMDNFISYPKGGSYTGQDSSLTGYCKITLPVSWTNTMMSFKIRIFNYVTGETTEYMVSGYNYSSSPGWHQCSAVCLGKPSATLGNLPVTFGHDGSKCVIAIGEATTKWAYPQVVVHSVLVGYSGNTFDNWNDGWSVGFATATLSNTLKISNTNVSYGATPKSHTHTLTPTTTDVYSITNVGTMFSASVSGEVLTLTAGTAPTRSSAIKAYTGLTMASYGV